MSVPSPSQSPQIGWSPESPYRNARTPVDAAGSSVTVTRIAPWLTPLAAAAVVVLMLFAVAFHLRRPGEVPNVALNAVLALVAGFIAYGRFVVAPLALEYPGIVSDTLEAGHEIGFHCTGHVRHTHRSRREVDEFARLARCRVQGGHILPREAFVVFGSDHHHRPRGDLRDPGGCIK